MHPAASEVRRLEGVLDAAKTLSERSRRERTKSRPAAPLTATTLTRALASGREGRAFPVGAEEMRGPLLDLPTAGWGRGEKADAAVPRLDRTVT